MLAPAKYLSIVLLRVRAEPISHTRTTCSIYNYRSVRTRECDDAESAWLSPTAGAWARSRNTRVWPHCATEPPFVEAQSSVSVVAPPRPPRGESATCEPQQVDPARRPSQNGERTKAGVCARKSAATPVKDKILKYQCVPFLD